MKKVEEKLKQIKNKKLLVVFPHPDDETVMASGLMLRAKELGWEVKVVCVTNGVLGRINVHGQGRSMVQIRREELTAAMKVLGAEEFELWSYCDGKLVDHVGWKKDVSAVVRKFKPGLVVSYGPSGLSGHPDHIVLGKHLNELVQNGKAEYELWWPALNDQVRSAIEEGVESARNLEVPELKLALNKDEVKRKLMALAAHKSQDLDKPVEWIKDDPSEYFTEPKKNRNYKFELVEFDLGD